MLKSIVYRHIVTLETKSGGGREPAGELSFSYIYVLNVDRRSKRDHLNYTELFDTLRFPTGLQQEIGADWDPG
jgi:hypothetical protein